MNAKVPKSYINLPKSERAIIDKLVSDEISKQVDKEEAKLQKIWIQLACIILHEAFGFGKTRCLIFLGNWKRIYKKNNKFSCEEEQEEYLRKEIDSIFGEGGYPHGWIDSLEEK